MLVVKEHFNVMLDAEGAATAAARKKGDESARSRNAGEEDGTVNDNSISPEKLLGTRVVVLHAIAAVRASPGPPVAVVRSTVEILMYSALCGP